MPAPVAWMSVVALELCLTAPVTVVLCSPVTSSVKPPVTVSLRPLEIAGRVAWTRHTEGEEGIGVEFKARDAGGTRRLKELVRRLEMLEAENQALDSDAPDRDDVAETA